MSNEIDRLANGVGKVFETVPEIYDDGIKPAVQESGKVLAIIPQTINAVLAPLRQWIAQKEYNVAETKKLLEQKLENVAPEKIVTPDAYIAVPAMQAISYSMDSKELRNLYANLLAKSMNSDTKDSVHPSFVEIIKQLSPIDANIFSLVMETDIRPLIDLNIAFSQGQLGTVTAIRNISWIISYPYNQVAVSLDNLERLNLISIKDKIYARAENYHKITSMKSYSKLFSDAQSVLRDNQVLSEAKKIIEITDLGKLFYHICVQ